MINPFNFNGKTVFIFGGTSGINLGIADAFAEQGARMAVASRSQDKVDAAVSALLQHGGQAAGFCADVRNPDAVAAAFAGASQAFGPIDVLVSGAAGNFPATALGMSPNGFKSVVDIDLLGSFHVLRAAYPHLTKPGAAIINISAPQAFLPMEYQAHVCAAKAGVDMLTRVLAMEWGAQGVRVNSIVPGPIGGTEGMERLAPTPALKASIPATVPLRREGAPREIRKTDIFLPSSLAGDVANGVFSVDRG